MQHWVTLHVSDHCGFHHIQQILQQIQKTCNISSNNSIHYIDFLEEEFSLTNKLILQYPGHESIWCHRRFLIYHWINLVESSSFGKSFDSNSDPYSEMANVENDQIFDKFQQLSYSPTLTSELQFVQCCKAENTIVNFTDQRNFATIYLLWLLEQLKGDQIQKFNISSDAFKKIKEEVLQEIQIYNYLKPVFSQKN